MTSIRFRTIGFDLDGTIADTAPDLMAALNHTLQSLGREPLPLDRVRSMIGHGTRALLRNGLAATGTADETEVAAGYPTLMDYYEAHVCDFTRPYPGVEAALDALAAQGIKLSVCTNKPERVSRLLIDALGWTDRFAAIVGGDTRAVTKPDPDPLHFAIERAGGGPAAFVGDSITDVQTAKAAGLPCVVVSFGFADRPADQLGADKVIDDFADLLPALAAL